MIGVVRRLACGLSGWAAVLTIANSVHAGPTESPLPRLETGMHTAEINGIATDRDGRWAVTASDDKTARVWKLDSGGPTAVLRPPPRHG